MVKTKAPKFSGAVEDAAKGLVFEDGDWLASVKHPESGPLLSATDISPRVIKVSAVVEEVGREHTPHQHHACLPPPSRQVTWRDGGGGWSWLVVMPQLPEAGEVSFELTLVPGPPRQLRVIEPSACANVSRRQRGRAREGP